MAAQPPAPAQEFKIVYIEGFEKGVTPEVLYNYLKKYNVKTIRMNKVMKSASAEFPSEEIAKDAMLNQNCKPILKKPVRMSLKCDKASTITEYSLLGLEKIDLNKLYRIACKYGRSCKLGFNVSEKNKVVTKGYVSYTEFQTDKEEALKQELLKEGVVLTPYNKTSRSSVRIDKFAEDSVKVDLTKNIDEYTKLFRTQLKELCNFNEGEYTISITAVPKGEINEFFAFISFDNVEKAARFYEEIQSVASNIFKLKPSISIRVSDETETMSNLVAFGINKPDGISAEDFEKKINESFKKVFKGILQVKLREVRKKEAQNKTAVGSAPPASDKQAYLLHVTLQSEEDGKDLMATYLEDVPKKEIKEYFINEPFFNIFCSSAFRKEFKRAKLGYKRMEKDIKNSLDAGRKTDIEMRNFAQKANMRPPFINPSMPGPIPSGMPMPRMPMGPIGMPAGFPMMGPMPHPMGMMAPPNMNPMGMMNPAMDLIARRKEFLKDKDNTNKDPTLIKKVATGYILNDLETLGIKDHRRVADYIIKNEDAKTIIGLVENIEELRKKAASINLDNVKQARQ